MFSSQKDIKTVRKRRKRIKTNTEHHHNVTKTTAHPQLSWPLYPKMNGANPGNHQQHLDVDQVFVGAWATPAELLYLRKKLFCCVQSKGIIVKTLSCKAIAHIFSVLRSSDVKDKSFTGNLSNQESVLLFEFAILFLSFLIFHCRDRRKRKVSPYMNCKLIGEGYKIGRR